MRSRETAEDLTQDVFVKLTAGISSYRPVSSFSAFLYRIAHNRVIDYYRTHGEAEELTEDMSFRDPGPHMEEKLFVRDMLKQLSPEQREGILLYYFHDLTYREIAQILEIPVPTVKSRVRRGIACCRRWAGGKEMFQFEFEKFRRQRILVSAVTLVMLAVYIRSAFRGLVLLVALCAGFSVERASSMVPILRTARYGRGRLVSMKVLRAWLITTVLWLIFQLGMLLAVAISYGLEGAEVTVMLGYPGYPSAWGLDNLQYYLIQSFFSYSGTVVQGLLICLLSCLFRTRLSLPAGLVLTMVSGFPNESFFSSDLCFGFWQKIGALTPAQMMGAFTTFQSYQSYDTGFCLIRIPAAVALAMILEAVFMIIFIYGRKGGQQ